MGWLTCTGTKCAPPSRLSFRTTCDPRVQEPKPADVHWPPSKMLLTCRRNRHQMRSRPQLCRGQPPNVVQRGRATTSRSDGHRRETLRRCPTRTRLSRFRQNATVAHFVMLLRKGRQRSIAGGTTFQRLVGDSVREQGGVGVAGVPAFAVLPTSLLDYHGARRGLEPPAERGATAPTAASHPTGPHRRARVPHRQLTRLWERRSFTRAAFIVR